MDRRFHAVCGWADRLTVENPKRAGRTAGPCPGEETSVPKRGLKIVPLLLASTPLHLLDLPALPKSLVPCVSGYSDPALLECHEPGLGRTAISAFPTLLCCQRG